MSESLFWKGFYKRSKFVEFSAIAPRTLLDATLKPNNKILLVSPNSYKLETIFKDLGTLFQGYPEREPLLRIHVTKPHPRIVLSNNSTVRGFTVGYRHGCSVRGVAADIIYIIEPEEIGEEILSSAIMPILYTTEDCKIFESHTEKRGRGLMAFPKVI